MNIYSFVIISFLYFYSGFLLFITYNAKKVKEKGAFINNLTNSLVLIFALTINLVIVNYSDLSNIDFIVFPFDIFMSAFIILFFPLFYLLIYREKKRVKKNKSPSKDSASIPHAELPLKYDIYRKMSHLVVLGIILFYFTLGFLIQNIFTNILLYLPEFLSEVFYSIFVIEGDIRVDMVFTQYLVVFLVGISLIGLLTADFIRILKPEIYPLKKVNRILREKELGARLGPQISMSIGCFSIILLYGLFQPLGPLIICTSMTMAIFGDISSNLFGRSLGKKKIRNTKKTYVGLFSGIFIAFISGISMLIILRDFYIISIAGFFLLPIIGSLIIGAIDYADLEIDDNLTYNFIVTTVLFYIAIFIA